MQGSHLGDDAPIQACRDVDWTIVGWEETLKLLRGGGWLDGTHFLVVKFDTIMHVVLALMVDERVEVLEEHKDLCLELSRLLVSEDVEMELKNARY